MDSESRWAPEAVLSDAHRRIGEDVHHAWAALASETQLAKWPLRPGPLSGTALGVKDIIDLAGLPTRCGSELTTDAPASRSASIVDRFLELGAVPVGKTVTTEFAYFRPGPTENPRAPGHTPGGSSSGSAAAVAAGHVPLAIGSQTAGSLIRPAAYCGIAGLVLPHGSVSLDGFSGLSPSLDAAGLLAPTVVELDRVHMALFPSSSPLVPVRRVLLWTGEDVATVSAPMRDAVLAAGAAVQDDDVEIVPLDNDGRVARLAEDHQTVMAYEAARERTDLRLASDGLSPQLRELLEAGVVIPDAAYAAAVERTRATREHFAELLVDGTVILGPAAPGAAPRGLSATGSPIMSRPWQLLGLPQLCIAGLIDGEGLPLGVQVIGGPEGADALLSLGCALERRLVTR